jgi:predicted transcriptional regulator
MERKVLLSIKPEFALKIFEGTKRYEFRKALFKDRSVKTIVVYASSPMQRVIGEFEIEDILFLEKEQLWKTTEKYSGIDKLYFDKYFQEKEGGYALKIKKITRYESPKELKDFKVNYAPQSFIYLK